MKSIIFNNNNSNGSSWKKQAMLVNILALSIIVLLLLIEQVNTKEMHVNIDLKDDVTKFDTTKAENLKTETTKAETAKEGKLENLAAAENLFRREDVDDPEFDKKQTTLFILEIVCTIIYYVICAGCCSAIIYSTIRALK